MCHPIAMDKICHHPLVALLFKTVNHMVLGHFYAAPSVICYSNFKPAWYLHSGVSIVEVQKKTCGSYCSLGQGPSKLNSTVVVERD